MHSQKKEAERKRCVGRAKEGTEDLEKAERRSIGEIVDVDEATRAFRSGQTETKSLFVQENHAPGDKRLTIFASILTASSSMTLPVPQVTSTKVFSTSRRIMSLPTKTRRMRNSPNVGRTSFNEQWIWRRGSSRNVDR